MNGESKSTNERGPSLVGRWPFRAGTRDCCPALAALVRPVQDIFFSSPYTIAITVICVQRAVKMESRHLPAIYDCGVMTNGCVPGT